MRGKVVKKPPSHARVVGRCLIRKVSYGLTVTKTNDFAIGNKAKLACKGVNAGQNFLFICWALLACGGPYPVPMSEGDKMVVALVVVCEIPLRIHTGGLEL